MKATQQLMDEHRGIEQMLRILEAVSSRLDAGEQVDQKDLEGMVEFIQVFADRCHHGKEEDLLFGAMNRKGIPSESGPIAVMLHEHGEGRSYVKGLADAVAAYGRGDKSAAAKISSNARGYIALLRQHIGKEDNILYPIADSRFSAEEDSALLEAFDKLENERIGPGRHEAFHAMLDSLTSKYLTEAASKA